jgi:hypothetical protein
MKKLAIAMTITAGAFAASGAATAGGFAGWTTAKTESALVAQLHAPPSAAKVASALAEWHAALAARDDLRSLLNSYCSYHPSASECVGISTRLRDAEARFSQAARSLQEARNGESPLDSRCVGLGKGVSAHYRQLRCIAIFPSTRWTVLVVPRTGTRFSYRRIS